MKSSSGSDNATLAGAGDARSTATSVEKATKRFTHPGSIKSCSQAKKRRHLRHCRITASSRAKHYAPRFLRRLTRAASTSYMCVLCRDIFSRRDILKRHFQNHYIRRGNPTNPTHLSHLRLMFRKALLRRRWLLVKIPSSDGSTFWLCLRRHN
ncbi:hypothetical protein BDP55DRAFT_685901 [Colletotrichum godetiae]|uniref:C2H2-type domain-containing protein n=1 Tax=Colletotrichum godetiae TaxID=1209918 RepID=A0AAJ0A6E3_9PEZI|nr:uncharacterized protein BDP55DRAFT_685901 [Colletotrichum godetiae]KAK1657343.1 hypothetical protein BDP55DRAFT_685901 [Colletotrichum godetiae]